VNYYEELGLTPRASAEEIHEAYRGLARLLHPDQQQDERLRRLADSQMKRLNELHAVLADPQRRRLYDLGLATEPDQRPALAAAPEGFAFRLRHRVLEGRGFWLVLAAMGLATLGWTLASAPGRKEPLPAAVVNAAATTTFKPPSAAVEARREVPLQISGLRREIEQLRRELGRLKREQVEEAPQPQPFTGHGGMVPVTPLAEALAQSGGQPAASPPPVQPVQPLALVRESPLSGAWVYVPPKVPAVSKSLYPPEFIEAVIAGENGVLRGRYRARYRVTDRPISPEVRFHFEGPAGDGAATLPWTGPGGATGEVSLKLISNNALELSWVATELGSQMDLVSGKAVLVRRH